MGVAISYMIVVVVVGAGIGVGVGFASLEIGCAVGHHNKTVRRAVTLFNSQAQ